MNTTALLIGDSPVKLWSLSSRERITRQLKHLKIKQADPLSLKNSLNSNHRCLLIRCDYLFELRTFQAMLDKGLFVLLSDDRSQIVAAHVEKDQVAGLADFMNAQFTSLTVADRNKAPPLQAAVGSLPTGDRNDLSAYDQRLRRAEPPLLEYLSANRTSELEDELYGNAYKGVTDLITKWAWPRLAKKVVRYCAQRSITPNQVTSIGFLLVILAGFLFYYGYFGIGLLAGWIMTLLDTVDGKLARVRVESSKIGNIFDHGIDLIHPPFWYLAWAAGLEKLGPDLPLEIIAIVIFSGYIGGRLAEGAFQQFCGDSIFMWRPFDSWFRLVTARRNPCMIILTLALLFHSPAAGLWGVVLWTVLTTIILWVRVFQGLKAKAAHGKRVPSWLAEPSASEQYPLSYPVFSRTRGAYKN